MKHCLTLIAALLLAAGCKTDGAESTAGSAAPEAEQSAHKGRSGKIDLPQRRANGGSEDRPALTEPGDGSDDRRTRREERRKTRMEELDTNHDGQISDAERDVARKARMDEMRARLDTDGDGKLTVDELAASRISRRFGDVSTIDTDKNGEVSTEEMQKAMEDMRAQGWGRRGGGAWGGQGGPGGRGSAAPTQPDDQN